MSAVVDNLVTTAFAPLRPIVTAVRTWLFGIVITFAVVTIEPMTFSEWIFLPVGSALKTLIAAIGNLALWEVGVALAYSFLIAPYISSAMLKLFIRKGQLRYAKPTLEALEEKYGAGKQLTPLEVDQLHRRRLKGLGTISQLIGASELIFGVALSAIIFLNHTALATLFVVAFLLVWYFCTSRRLLLTYLKDIAPLLIYRPLERSQ